MAKGSKPPTGPLTHAVGEILRAQAGRKQLNKTQLSELTGIPRTTLSPILDGKKHADIEMLDEICVTLDLNLVTVIKQADAETEYRHLL